MTSRDDYVLLLFSHDKGDWISRVMAWMSFARWTHVAIVSPDRASVIEASGYGRPRGVRLVPLGDWVRKHPDCVFRRIWHPAPDKMWEVCHSQLGKGYDWWWLFGWVVRNRHIQAQSKWVCSELITWACSQAGRTIFGGDTWRVTPQMLYDVSEPVD